MYDTALTILKKIEKYNFKAYIVGGFVRDYILNIDSIEALSDLKITGEYIIEVEGRLNEGVKDSSSKEVIADLKGFNKKEQELLSDIISLLKEKLSADKTKDTYNTYLYLYHFLQSMETTEVLRFILGYMSKSLGFTDPMEFVFDNNIPIYIQLVEQLKIFIISFFHIIYW